ncbi:hypothetical protein F4775DRAFT_427432 [Biscogniauxia sp. FL1348]|nr:hypothetical protein F4775DRAFT_427432 [Biscogniauxia sp. FL1348]
MHGRCVQFRSGKTKLRLQVPGNRHIIIVFSAFCFNYLRFFPFLFSPRWIGQVQSKGCIFFSPLPLKNKNLLSVLLFTFFLLFPFFFFSFFFFAWHWCVGHCESTVEK